MLNRRQEVTDRINSIDAVVDLRRRAFRTHRLTHSSKPYSRQFHTTTVL
jgi:hypothetical protein